MGAFSLRYWSTGPENPPVILLHGFTGDGRSWNRVATKMRPERTVVAVDLPGHDGRTKPATAYRDWHGVIDALARSIRKAPLHDSYLVGYSLGGRVALGLLIEHPDLFVGGTLIGASAGLRLEDERVERRREDRAWIDLLNNEGIEAFVDRWESLPMFASQSRVPEEFRCEQRANRLAHDPEALAGSLETLGLGAMPNYWDELSEVRCPVHVIAGEEDEKFRRIGRSMAAKLPRGSFGLVAQSGHNIPLEAPEQIASLIETNLRTSLEKKERIPL